MSIPGVAWDGRYLWVVDNGTNMLYKYDTQFNDVSLPFGSFDSPLNGTTVSGSIPVTGWALDDTGVAHVKLYREQDNSLII